MMDPMEPIHNIQDKLKREAKALGLEMYHALWIPGEHRSDPTVVQAYFRVNPDAVLTEDEQTDKEFEALMGTLADVPEDVDPVSDLKENLRQQMKDGKGIFGDLPEL